MSTEAPKPIQVSIVIPTYGREQTLLDTISALLGLDYQASEILIVDQTLTHQETTEKQLREWHEKESIKWVKRKKPSITEAMNNGLVAANNNLVLFLDDDIIPHEGLVLNHARAHKAESGLWATVGQVIQPWQKSQAVKPEGRLDGLQKDFDFPFYSTLDADVSNVMAGNLCVNRKRALGVGGFDENFVGAAYRFETDFARRIKGAGGKVRFIGSAGIDHLRVASGGTRSKGNHMTSASPLHGFGDYYYAFRHGGKGEAWKYSTRRFFREVRTKFHLTRPWWIPVKMLGEARAILMARRALRSGQKLIENGVAD